MKTPEEYTKNLKKGIITDEMLNQCLYSVNKRAKNYRDRKKGYYGDYQYYSMEKKEKEFYKKKEKLLSLLNPVCIHKELIGYEKERVYSYEDDYDKKCIKRYLLDQIVYANSYLDYDTYDEVFFFDYWNYEKPIYLYFLFYELGTKSYHTPIENPNNYNLPIETIGRLNTYGENCNNLISIQFVNKVIKLIKTGKYVFKETKPTISQKYDNKPFNFENSNNNYYEDKNFELKKMLNTYVEDEVKKQCLTICKKEEFTPIIENIKIKQKYSRKKSKYIMPQVCIKNSKISIVNSYEMTNEMIEKMQEIVKKENYEISDLVKLICDKLPYEIYKNYFIRQKNKDIAIKINKKLIQMYNKQINKNKPLEFDLNKILDEVTNKK